MPIDFQCNQCQHTLRVPEESVGKKARCPQCGQVQDIPTPQQAPGSAGFDIGNFDAPSAKEDPPSGYAGQQQPYQSYPDSPQPYRPNPYQAPAHGGYYAPQPKSLEQVKSRVRPPAIALMIVSVLSGLLAMLCMLVVVASMADRGGNADEDDVIALVFMGIGLLMQFVIFAGAARMVVLKNYGLAITAAVLSLVSGLCCQLLMPFGIWALVILADADTRARFD